MATDVAPPPGYRTLGTFQLSLVERWVMASFVGLILFTLAFFELWRFAGGEMWFLLFVLSALLMTPVIVGLMQGHMDIFEPIFMVCAAYFLYMVWGPSVDWLSATHNIFGTDIVSTIRAGTMHTIVGIAAMLAGYYVRFGASHPPRKSQSAAVDGPRRDFFSDPALEASAVRYALILSAVAVVCLGLTMRLTGWNWARLLSLGQLGASVTSVWLVEQNPFLNYLFLTLEWFMPVMLILVAFMPPSGSKKPLLAIAFLFIFVMYTTLGFRYRVLMLILGPLVYRYMLQRRRPGIAAILAAVALTVVMVTVIAGTRGQTRGGRQLDAEAFELQESGTRFASDLRIYPPYYQLIAAFPQDHDFLWGSSYLYVFLSPIPRALWPGKPDAPVRLILRVAYGEGAVRQGVSYPNLGEFYVNFGLPGEILGMCLFGFLLRQLWDYTRRNAHNRWVLISYSLWLPFLVQVVSRGYFVQIVQEIAFVFLPVVAGMKMFGPAKSRLIAARIGNKALMRRTAGAPTR